jgi:integrase
MVGQIYPRGKCPVCHLSFEKIPRLGFICKTHQTKPDRFRISLYWHKPLYIYSDKQGKALDSYLRAYDLLAYINEEIRAKTFEPSKYIRSERSAFWFRNLAVRFWESKKSSIAPSYQGDYKRIIDRACAFFGPKDIREIRKSDLIDFHQTLFNLSPKTQKNHLDIIKTFLRWIMDDREMIAKVPAFPHIEKTVNIPRWISREDQGRILDLVPGEDRPIIEFCMTYGVRPGEARALRVQDIDWGNQTILIRSTFSGSVIREKRKGRGSPPLSLPIMPQVASYLEIRLKEAVGAACVFPNPRTGQPYQEGAIRRLWERIRGLAGIDRRLRLYDATRHSLASQLKQAGVSIDRIKDILGHTDIRTTLKYAHMDLSSKREDLEKLAVNKIVAIDV